MGMFGDFPDELLLNPPLVLVELLFPLDELLLTFFPAVDAACFTADPTAFPTIFPNSDIGHFLSNDMSPANQAKT